MKRPALYFIVLSALASFFNYAVYPVLARVLSDQAFIDIALGLALFTQISSFMLSIVALTIGISKQGSKGSKETVEKLQAVLAHIFIAVLLIFTATYPLYYRELHLPVALLGPICIMLALSVSMSIISGYLNGKQQLVKLGILISGSALLQLVLSVAFAYATESGTFALYGMAAGSLIAISAAYVAYKDQHLPSISSVFVHKTEMYKSSKMRSLIKYAVFASMATLLMNILLVIDLLIVNSRQIDAGIYTDVYVISRVVFFAGMLFIWPFLSEVNIRKGKHNTILLGRLTGLFVIIGLLASAIMLLFGTQVTNTLLGSGHTTDLANVGQLAVLAITYKVIFLAITALALYFIVIRSYLVVVFCSLLGALTLLVVLFSAPTISTAALISRLIIASSISLAFGFGVFYKINMQTQ